jgi:PAS domain S-box-containing protein
MDSDGRPRSAVRRAFHGIGVALGTNLAIAALHGVLAAYLGPHGVLLLCTLAVAFSAAVGGVLPGVIATGLAMAGWVHFFPGSSPYDRAVLMAFAAVGLFISALCGLLRRALAQSRRAAQAAAREGALLRRSVERFRTLFESSSQALRMAHEDARRNFLQLEAALAAMHEGLAIVDADGRLLAMNEAGLRMYGFNSLAEAQERIAELVEARTPDGELLPLEEWPILRAVRGERLEGVELCVQRRDDGRIWFGRYSGGPVRDGGSGRQLGLVTFQDVTEQKRAEEEREHLLESERAARSEAERASRLKDDFLATVSHELRPPLTAILGWAQLLQRPDRSPEQVLRGLEVIERNARMQAQLIADLLDVSRIVTGKIRLEVRPTEIEQVLESALESVRHAAEAKSIRLQRKIEPLAASILADPGRLSQVVWNLLSNAIKFTPRGGRVTLSLRASPSHLAISVEDTGQGIPPEFLPHVFERFRQADASASRQFGGLGLGLSIVKHLVELHGGRVAAESDGPGRGARFVVELPLLSASSLEEAGGAENDEQGGPRSRHSWQMDEPMLAGVRVLLVDDEEDTRELVRRLLLECQAEVLTAISAREALELLAEGPDVLVSDLGMPGMDGYALIRSIRGERGIPPSALPAVALTAFARPEDRRRALLCGYQRHVSKPVDPNELLSAVAELSGKRGIKAQAAG